MPALATIDALNRFAEALTAVYGSPIFTNPDGWMSAHPDENGEFASPYNRDSQLWFRFTDALTIDDIYPGHRALRRSDLAQIRSDYAETMYDDRDGLISPQPGWTAFRDFECVPIQSDLGGGFVVLAPVGPSGGERVVQVGDCDVYLSLPALGIDLIPNTTHVGMRQQLPTLADWLNHMIKGLTVENVQVGLSRNLSFRT